MGTIMVNFLENFIKDLQLNEQQCILIIDVDSYRDVH